MSTFKLLYVLIILQINIYTSNDWTDAHNTYRKNHNSNDVVWNQEQADVAKAWAQNNANAGSMSHSDCYSMKPPRGENIYMSSMKPTALDVVGAWQSEVNNVESYNPQKCKANTVCGHFTALVWKGVTKIGCGISSRSSNGQYFVVCNYISGDTLSSDTVNFNKPSNYPSHVFPKTGSSKNKASGTKKTVTKCAKGSLKTCGSCLQKEECAVGQCCPYMKKCVDNSRTPCGQPIAECRPMCFENILNYPQSCSCKNKNFPDDQACNKNKKVSLNLNSNVFTKCPAKSIKSCGNCLQKSECAVGFCCPYMKKCVATSSTPCYGQNGKCTPKICFESQANYPASCKCQNKDFPYNWGCNLNKKKPSSTALVTVDKNKKVDTLKEVGCFKDKANRALPKYMGNKYTPETCSNKCSKFDQMGLQYYGECFCGNGDSQKKYGKSTNCNAACNADKSIMCGGSWANNVYSLKESSGKVVNKTLSSNKVNKKTIQKYKKSSNQLILFIWYIQIIF